MVSALYRELRPRRQQSFDAHLTSCERCAAEYRELQLTLQVMDRRELPQVPATYWEGFWERLSERLTPKERRPHPRDWLGWLQPWWNPK